ncbi:hypothetical protein E2C01_001734 [Portunus trituberculatus]|uniref:Uncharacterized protein n=1 Tax=Portunus trituberculatus TaxID=210409 RepID=A0A5B7CK05_PORTR|nr:hypothetical protein [Portunus trituberculatus]
MNKIIDTQVAPQDSQHPLDQLTRSSQVLIGAHFLGYGYYDLSRKPTKGGNALFMGTRGTGGGRREERRDEEEQEEEEEEEEEGQQYQVAQDGS